MFMKDTSAKLMLVPGGAKRTARLWAEKREGTTTSAKFVETTRCWVVCARVCLTKAGITGNWLPASESDGVSESVQELVSYFSQGNDMSRPRLKFGGSGVTVQSGCTSPSSLGVTAEPLGDTPSNCTPFQPSSTIENVFLAVKFQASKGAVVVWGDNEHERARGGHKGAELINCFLLPLLILATYLADAMTTIRNLNPMVFPSK